MAIRFDTDACRIPKYGFFNGNVVRTQETVEFLLWVCVSLLSSSLAQNLALSSSFNVSGVLQCFISCEKEKLWSHFFAYRFKSVLYQGILVQKLAIQICDVFIRWESLNCFSLRKESPYSEFFWSEIFPRTRITPYADTFHAVSKSDLISFV